MGFRAWISSYVCVLGFVIVALPANSQSKFLEEAGSGERVAGKGQTAGGERKRENFAEKVERMLLPEKQVLELGGVKGARLPTLEEETRRISANSTDLAEDFIGGIEKQLCGLGDLGAQALKSFSGMAIGGAFNVPLPYTRGYGAAGISCDVAMIRDKDETKKAGKQKMVRGLGCAVEGKVGRIPGVEADVDVFFNCGPKDVAGFGLHANLGGYSIKTTMYTPRDEKKIAAERVEQLTKDLRKISRDLKGSLEALKKNPSFASIDKAMKLSVKGQGLTVSEMMAKVIGFHGDGLKKLNELLDDVDTQRKLLDKGYDENVAKMVQKGNLAKLMEAQGLLEALSSSLQDAIGGQLDENTYRVTNWRGKTRLQTDRSVKKGSLEAIDNSLVFGSEYHKATFKHLYGGRRNELFEDPFGKDRKSVSGFLLDDSGKVVGALLKRQSPDVPATKWSDGSGEWAISPKADGKDVDFAGLKMNKQLVDALGPDLIVALPPGYASGKGLKAVSVLEVREVQDHYKNVLLGSEKLKKTLDEIADVNGKSAAKAKQDGWQKGKGGWFNGCFALSFPVKELLIHGPRVALAAAFRNAIPTLISMGLLSGAAAGAAIGPNSDRGKGGKRFEDLITKNAKFGGQTGGVLGGTLLADRLIPDPHHHGSPSSLWEVMKKNFKPNLGHELYVGAYYLQALSKEKVDAGAQMAELFDRIDSGKACREAAPVVATTGDSPPHVQKDERPAKQETAVVKQEPKNLAVGEKKAEKLHVVPEVPAWKQAAEQAKIEAASKFRPAETAVPKIIVEPVVKYRPYDGAGAQRKDDLLKDRPLRDDLRQDRAKKLK